MKKAVLKDVGRGEGNFSAKVFQRSVKLSAEISSAQH